MNTITELTHMKPITVLQVVSLPNGKYGYAGRVPVEIGYIDATPEKIEAAKFGARFGPNRRTFSTEAEAVEFAVSHGYTIGV